MGTIAQKGEYLEETKGLIAESINNLGGSITSETTFREYAQELDTIYSNLPKVTGENTEVILTPTLKGKLGIVEKGNSTQEGTPTPTTPIPIKSVTGDNNVVVRNSDNTQSQTLPLNLGNIELNGIDNYNDLIFKAVNGNSFYDSLTSEQKALLTYGKWYKHEVIEEKDKDYLVSQLGQVDIITNYVRIRPYLNVACISTPTGLCSHLKYEASYSGQSNHFYAQGNFSYLIVDKTLLPTTDLAGAKTYLNTLTGLKILYPKATSTDIEITDTNLINQLEDIDKMQGYNGTTIITSTFDSNNAQMIISASGLKGE